MIQTTPARNIDGTVVICLKDGQVEEVVSDLQLHVQIFSVDDDCDGNRYGGGYQGTPSRPLWEFLRKLIHFHSTNEK
jgi:hypothetical protein